MNQRLVIGEAIVHVQMRRLVDLDQLEQTLAPFAIMRIEINEMTSALERKGVDRKNIRWSTEPGPERWYA